MKQRLFILSVILLSGMAISAQDFKGIIINAKQNPIKGMKVWRKNTTESVKTDKMGLFFFSGINSKDTLVISVSRREEAVIPVEKLSQVSIKIEKNFFTLFNGEKEIKREYSRKIRTVYSSNVLTREQIQKLSANNIYDIFKGGTIPGVTVNGNKITIRGGTSLDLDNEPLFVVDNTLYENSNEVNNSIAVNDIDKIEIQKDGSIYGAKGSNGAIIITTANK